ncbi:MAG: hypothetical protein NZ699_05495 [Roseiflexus sp.]|nr:hypothetical protein [Roseiflexus sp.]MCS7288571.1 hypothetical protein [Roseiflexus sp.]MDW8145290.1 hypothetical protein [Roseiflexaceae bacterium]MDW8232047.1 hypothetical protein [Roseiflexaceae bacterium]
MISRRSIFSIAGALALVVVLALLSACTRPAADLKVRTQLRRLYER